MSESLSVSSLLCQMFDLRRYADPGILARFVDRDSRRGKRGVRKSSYRYHDFVFEAFDLVVHGGSAIRAEVKRDSVALIAYSKLLL